MLATQAMIADVQDEKGGGMGIHGVGSQAAAFLYH